MEYQVNPAKLGAVFMLPCEVVDKHIKLAKENHLKVLLWVMRNIGGEVTDEKIADALRLHVLDVQDALQYWVNEGILLGGQAPAPAPAVEPTAKVKSAKAVMTTKPNRDEVIRRGNESEQIAFLLREAQMKFGRGLRQSEASTLVWLADDEGMNIAVILTLIEFAKSEEKCTIGYIERTALEWIKDGVTTLSQAEEKICQIGIQRTAWGKVCSAMGLEHRRPSKKELAFAVKWADEWGFTNEMLRAAYDKCVDATSKLSMSYVNKVLEGWQKNGIKTVDAISEEAKKAPVKDKAKASYAGYDLSKIEQLLSEDEE